MSPEPSGDDRSLIAVVSRETISPQSLARAGLAGRCVGRAKNAVLFDVAGFVAADDPRLQNLKGKCFVIGAYATPLPLTRGEA